MPNGAVGYIVIIIISRLYNDNNNKIAIIGEKIIIYIIYIGNKKYTIVGELRKFNDWLSKNYKIIILCKIFWKKISKQSQCEQLNYWFTEINIRVVSPKARLTWTSIICQLSNTYARNSIARWVHYIVLIYPNLKSMRRRGGSKLLFMVGGGADFVHQQILINRTPSYLPSYKQWSSTFLVLCRN